MAHVQAIATRVEAIARLEAIAIRKKTRNEHMFLYFI